LPGAVVFGDDDDAVVAEGEAAAAVLFQVVSDDRGFGDDYAFVDDRAADLGAAADGDLPEDRVATMPLRACLSP
jgi:hypothetical protein